MHYLVLFLCTAMLSWSFYSGCYLIAEAVGSFTIQVIKDGEVEKEVTERG